MDSLTLVSMTYSSTLPMVLHIVEMYDPFPSLARMKLK